MVSQDVNNKSNMVGIINFIDLKLINYFSLDKRKNRNLGSKTLNLDLFFAIFH